MFATVIVGCPSVTPVDVTDTPSASSLNIGPSPEFVISNGIAVGSNENPGAALVSAR